MRTSKFAPRIGSAALALTALAMASSQALAAEYWLEAKLVDITLPDLGGGTITVPSWGYAKCEAAFANCGTAATVPGPALSVPADEAVLIVHLKNSLSQPTSLVINGLFKAMAPVWDNGATGSRPVVVPGVPPARVRSFDAEAAAGGTQDYTWSNVMPGTYLYQSGTQPQVQVQMGLYGAVTKNAKEATPTVRAQAYGDASTYDNQATLLYSEIDPDLHMAVGGASPTYGTEAGPTSTFNYQPKYFLINGAPYQLGSTPAIVPAGNAGTTLLRLLNAGLTTHVPSIHGLHWDAIAEDGKAYPYKRTQYTALLPAAKTMDVLLTPTGEAPSYPIMDRRLNLSNAGLPNGGMLAFLSYGAVGIVGATPGDTNVPPVAVNDTYPSVLGVELAVNATDGVLGNDTDADTPPQPIKAIAASGSTSLGGSYALSANGSFKYVPPTAVSGAISDTFSYTITDGKAISAPAIVTIPLSIPTAPPLTGAGGDGFDVPGVLNASNWAVSGALGVSAGQAVANSAEPGQAIWTKAPDTGLLGASQFASFSSSELSKVALILKATGGNISSAAPANFVRVRLENGSVVVATQVGGSNAPVYVKQAAFQTSATGGILTAAIDAKGLVTVFLGGSFLGGVQLPDVGVWKGTGRIGIQLQGSGASLDDFLGGTL
jgi:FtsP/CotA-like multicopper oxidase with cupredoxin domain